MYQRLKLFPDAAPKAVENFVTHVRNGELLEGSKSVADVQATTMVSNSIVSLQQSAY